MDHFYFMQNKRLQKEKFLNPGRYTKLTPYFFFLSENPTYKKHVFLLGF